MGKTIDVLKKIRHTKGIFHAKMSTIKDRKIYGPNRYYEEVARIHRRTIKERSI